MQEQLAQISLTNESTFHVITSRRIGFIVRWIGLVYFCNMWQIVIILLEPYEELFKDRSLLIGLLLLGVQIQYIQIW